MENPVTLIEAFMKASTQEFMLDDVVKDLKEHGPFRLFLKSCVAFVAKRITAEYSTHTFSAIISALMEEPIAADRTNVRKR